MNVWVILFLMTGVAGFTMISGLLIIIPGAYQYDRGAESIGS